MESWMFFMFYVLMIIGLSVITWFFSSNDDKVKMSSSLAVIGLGASVFTLLWNHVGVNMISKVVVKTM